MTKPTSFSAPIIIVLLFSSLVAFAGQSQEVHGAVADETGAIIVGAKVSLDDGQGRIQAVVSDEAGRYRFEAVPPGRYTLIVSAQGFADFSEPIDLTTRRTVPLNVTMKVV